MVRNAVRAVGRGGHGFRHRRDFARVEDAVAAEAKLDDQARGLARPGNADAEELGELAKRCRGGVF